MTIRKEFETLQDVKDILEDYPSIYFKNESNMYASKSIVDCDSVFYPSWQVTYLNGGWYVFQELKNEFNRL